MKKTAKKPGGAPKMTAGGGGGKGRMEKAAMASGKKVKL